MGAHRVRIEAMSAILSTCGKYRYRLDREFDFTGEGRISFVMLNPSTADATQDDPTIRRCIGYAKKWGAARLTVVNLFAFRSTDPDVLYGMSKSEAIGPENDRHIFDVWSQSKLVICAWGNHGKLHGRGAEVLRLGSSVSTPMALKINTSSNQPAHPLYLKGDAKPVMLASV